MNPLPGRADALPGAPPWPSDLAARLEDATKRRAGPFRTRHLQAGRPRFTNRLVLERSPYLQQHAHNPVNWYPWREEAFAVARQTKRPLFLSIGYSTCHWCHVMEEESFEDLEIAEFLNRHFVAVKVDREERPDVDGVYMAAVQQMTGRGGWPLSAFLTPEGKPFYGGTYFPPRDHERRRRIGFLTVLRSIQQRYQQDATSIAASADQLAATLRESLDPPAAVGIPGPDQLERALADYRRGYDAEHGGLRSRTKFPSLLPISLLLRIHRRSGDPEPLAMARKTLDEMLRGGIYDHVGGGFHRYTVEPTWTVPHFEKMLYDNALLVVAYLEASQVTADPRYAERVRDVLSYLLREMRAPEGAFYAATDADSEGEEGRFYVWTAAEVREAAGEELAPLALAAYGVTERGNFEGRNVLRRDRTLAELAEELGVSRARVERDLRAVRQRLLEVRSRRVAPHTDRKQIVAWNGLAVSALARAGLVLEEASFLEQARATARLLLEQGRPGGTLARYLFEGKPHGVGFLDDHAFLIAGLLDLFEATGEEPWIVAAQELQASLDLRFFDEARGGFYRTPSDGETLLVREKPGRDGAVPSGNSVAALNLLRLHALTTREPYRVRAEMTLRAFSEALDSQPARLNRMLDAVDFQSDRSKEILIVAPTSSDEARPFLRELAQVFLPNRVLLATHQDRVATLVRHVPLLKHKRALRGRTTAYVCENGVCDLPARDVATFRRQIRAKPEPYRKDGLSAESVAP